MCDNSLARRLLGWQPTVRLEEGLKRTIAWMREHLTRYRPMPTPFEPGVPLDTDAIPLSVPEIRGNEWQYVKECLDTNWVSSVGAFVDRFEQAMAEHVGCRRAVATVNGTAALHVALRVAGVQADDEVLVSDLTFIAPVNAIRYLGAWPVFIDAEPRYWQMDPQRVAGLSGAAMPAGKTAALRNRATAGACRRCCPSTFSAIRSTWTRSWKLARKFELPVVEDATESLGAKYKGRRVGSLGDIACFSYNGNKIITTGGGGMIVTDNEALGRQGEVSDHAGQGRSAGVRSQRDRLQLPAHERAGGDRRGPDGEAGRVRGGQAADRRSTIASGSATCRASGP